MHFGELIGRMPEDGGRFRIDPPEDWRQGRTLYGGLALALAGAAAARAFPNLPPLRAVQMAFLGPTAGEVTLVPAILRAGRSMTFVGVDVFAAGALAGRALFAHGAARPSALAASAPPPPDAAAPDACPPLFETAERPAFSHHFDLRRAGRHRLVSAAPEGDLLVWVRNEARVPPSTAALLLLADGLPPASYTRLAAPAAISTVTWSFELFAPEVHRGAGWHLLRATDDGVGQGYAGQAMAMWDADGRPVLRGRQAVALFA